MQLGHSDVIPPSPPSCIGVEGTVSRQDQKNQLWNDCMVDVNRMCSRMVVSS